MERMKQFRDIQDARLGKLGLLSAVFNCSNSQINRARSDSVMSVLSVAGDEPHCRAVRGKDKESE